MEDLHNSPFFDSRTLEFVSKLLRGERVNPISSNEQKLSELAHVLKEINGKLDGSLVSRLNRYKNAVAVITAIQFLAYCHRRDRLDDAIAILDVAREDSRTANLKELVSILDETKDMPAEWAVAIKAHEIEDRHKPPPESNLSGLNLEAMRNFK